METVQYAGVILYRVQRSVEFLLVNDSYSNKRHWAPPKGKVLGNEDEIKCAVRETADTTGLSPQSITIDPPPHSFTATIKYLSGTTPKHVILHLGHINSRERIAPGGLGMAGLHIAWFGLNQACEKVVYKNVQEVLRKAAAFVEEVRSRMPPPAPSTAPAVSSGTNGSPGIATTGRSQSARNGANARGGVRNGGNEGGRHRTEHSKNVDESPVATGSTHRGTPSRSGSKAPLIFAPNGSSKNWRARVTATNEVVDGNVVKEDMLAAASSAVTARNRPPASENPLYKTRLCERFELEGTCPYGARCTFAHGAAELRDRSTFIGEHDGASTGTTTASKTVGMTEVNLAPGTSTTAAPGPENPLYKTKMCERFLKDGFCQYGPRCNFAHTKEELRERPAPVLSGTTWSGTGEKSEIKPREPQKDAWREREETFGVPPSVVREVTGAAPVRPKISSSTERMVLGPVSAGTLFNKAGVVPVPVKAAPVVPAPKTVVVVGSKPSVVATLVNEGKKDKAITSKKSADSVSLKDIMSDKDKIGKDRTLVVLSQPHSANLMVPPSPTGTGNQSPLLTSTRTPSPAPPSPNPGTVKIPQLTKSEETVIKELKKFFYGTEEIPAPMRTLAEETKEVTRLEFKHDLGKLQVFNVLIGSLFEDGYSVEKLKARERLFKQFLRSTTDQTFFLKAWDRAMNRLPDLMRKGAVVFKNLYDAELVDEDVLVRWCEDGAPGVSEGVREKCRPLVEWLKTAEEEEEDV